MPIAYLFDVTSSLAAPSLPPAVLLSYQSRIRTHPIKPSATRNPALMNLLVTIPLIPNNELYERTFPRAVVLTNIDSYGL